MRERLINYETCSWLLDWRYPLTVASVRDHLNEEAVRVSVSVNGVSRTSVGSFPATVHVFGQLSDKCGFRIFARCVFNPGLSQPPHGQTGDGTGSNNNLLLMNHLN